VPARECLAFEDSPAGLRSASAAGLRSVVTPGAYTRDEDFDGAWALLDGLGEDARPARGRVAGADWSGVVDPQCLRRWAQVGQEYLSR
jgi:beta-phosphoglucomutase-like phosphatase (HAD superfamily)